MKRNAPIIILLVVIILVVIVYFIFTNFNKPEENLISNCIKSGEIYQSPAILGKIRGNCCGNAISIAQVSAIDCNSQFTVAGGNLICSNCGNKACEPWENKCNCPEDCK